MSYLLNKVKGAGYRVYDSRNALGIRIITISSPNYSIWFRGVLNPAKGISEFRVRAESIVKRCQNYINNPIAPQMYRNGLIIIP